MRNYTVSLVNEEGEREVEFTSQSSALAKDYYQNAISISSARRELGIHSGSIYNTLLDNYSVSEWTPTIQKTIPISDKFKRKENETYFG